MGSRFKLREVFFPAVVICVILFLSGCLFMPTSYTQGKVIKEETVKSIVPGKTTKEEIIQMFGIPSIIQKQGEKASSDEKRASAVPMMGAMSMVTDQSFDLFSAKHKITESHRIYVYSFTKSAGTSFHFVFVGTSSMHTLTDKLLVLINEKTGIVDDYIFRKEN